MNSERQNFVMRTRRGRDPLIGRFLKDSPIKGHRDVSPEWERTRPELVQRYYMKSGKAQAHSGIFPQSIRCLQSVWAIPHKSPKRD